MEVLETDGNSVRGSGILMNAFYDGRLVWNRVSMHKDPDTGRRVSRANPESEWITTPVPHLRIVEPEPRRIQPASAGAIIAFPEVGGLHHRYERRAA